MNETCQVSFAIEENEASTTEKVMLGIIWILLEIVGNGLIFGLIQFDRLGGDPLKRRITDQVQWFKSTHSQKIQFQSTYINTIHFIEHQTNSNEFIYWWSNSNTLFLASNEQTSNIEPNRAFTRCTKFFIELSETSFFRTLNELECVYLIVIKLEHPIFGYKWSNIRVPSILATFTYQKTGFIIVVKWYENPKNSFTNDLSFKTW